MEETGAKKKISTTKSSDKTNFYDDMNPGSNESVNLNDIKNSYNLLSPYEPISSSEEAYSNDSVGLDDAFKLNEASTSNANQSAETNYNFKKDYIDECFADYVDEALKEEIYKKKKIEAKQLKDDASKIDLVFAKLDYENARRNVESGVPEGSLRDAITAGDRMRDLIEYTTKVSKLNHDRSTYCAEVHYDEDIIARAIEHANSARSALSKFIIDVEWKRRYSLRKLDTSKAQDVKFDLNYLVHNLKEENSKLEFILADRKDSVAESVEVSQKLDESLDPDDKVESKLNYLKCKEPILTMNKSFVNQDKKLKSGTSVDFNENITQLEVNNWIQITEGLIEPVAIDCKTDDKVDSSELKCVFGNLKEALLQMEPVFKVKNDLLTKTIKSFLKLHDLLKSEIKPKLDLDEKLEITHKTKDFKKDIAWSETEKIFSMIEKFLDDMSMFCDNLNSLYSLTSRSVGCYNEKIVDKAKEQSVISEDNSEELEESLKKFIIDNNDDNQENSEQ